MLKPHAGSQDETLLQQKPNDISQNMPHPFWKTDALIVLKTRITQSKFLSNNYINHRSGFVTLSETKKYWFNKLHSLTNWKSESFFT